MSRDRWIAERKTLPAREKELTRLSDQLARERRARPWVRIEKNYVFEGIEGRRTLAELFQGRRQLMVQHFMFAQRFGPICDRLDTTHASSTRGSKRTFNLALTLTLY